MKRKAKAIHAELRKESKSFDGWLKYEVTIEYPNGKTEQVPAYGKDLQDALSRVAHDKKVEKLARINLPTIQYLADLSYIKNMQLELKLKHPKHVVVSLSGGMDSSTLLLRCLKEYDTVTGISFDYGQKHRVELERAQS